MKIEIIKKQQPKTFIYQKIFEDFDKLNGDQSLKIVFSPEENIHTISTSIRSMLIRKYGKGRTSLNMNQKDRTIYISKTGEKCRQKHN